MGGMLGSVLRFLAGRRRTNVPAYDLKRSDKWAEKFRPGQSDLHKPTGSDIGPRLETSEFLRQKTKTRISMTDAGTLVSDIRLKRFI